MKAEEIGEEVQAMGPKGSEEGSWGAAAQTSEEEEVVCGCDGS